MRNLYLIDKENNTKLMKNNIKKIDLGLKYAVWGAILGLNLLKNVKY